MPLRHAGVIRPVNSAEMICLRLAHRSRIVCICAVFQAITMLASKLCVGRRLHLVGALGLRRARSSSIDRALEGIDRLAAIEHPPQLSPKAGVDDPCRS